MCRFISYKSSAVLSAVETGISDFHKMVVTVLKVFYKKQKPKIIKYRKYSNFNNDMFQEDLNNELLNVHLNNAELSEYTETFMFLLDKHASKNKKINEQIMLTLWQKVQGRQSC